MKDEIKRLEKSDDLNKEKKIKQLEKKYTLGNVNFNSVIIAVRGLFSSEGHNSKLQTAFRNAYISLIDTIKSKRKRWIVREIIRESVKIG